MVMFASACFVWFYALCAVPVGLVFFDSRSLPNDTDVARRAAATLVGVVWPITLLVWLCSQLPGAAADVARGAETLWFGVGDLIAPRLRRLGARRAEKAAQRRAKDDAPNMRIIKQ